MDMIGLNTTDENRRAVKVMLMTRVPGRPSDGREAEPET
jgi:hypothetical protein